MENRYAGALRRARARDGFVDLINTNFHACGLQPPPEAIAGPIGAYLRDPGLRAYRPHPAGLPRLREAVVRFYGRDGVTVNANAVVATASASDSYTQIFRGVCRGTGEVLLPRPGYPLFEEIARRSGLVPRFYELRADSDWSIDVDEVARAVGSQTCALVVISPNNPTGSVVDAPTVAALGSLCAEHGLPLIVDEVFSAFRFRPDGAVDREPLPRPAALCPDTLVLSINGASKLLLSPDLKVSWIAVTGPARGVDDAVEALEIENDLYLNASPLNQFAAATLLDEAPGWIEEAVERVARRRLVMLEALAEASERCDRAIAWCAPEGAIHLPVTIARPPADLDDEELAIGLLEEQAVAVHPGYLYGIEDAVVLVTSYLSPPEVIREGVRRIAAFVNARRTS